MEDFQNLTLAPFFQWCTMDPVSSGPWVTICWQKDSLQAASSSYIPMTYKSRSRSVLFSRKPFFLSFLPLERGEGNYTPCL